MDRKMTFQPTPEQAAIVNFVKTEKPSLLISALAGAAKTSTLALICESLPSQPILSLAFNRRIAEEMTKRLPSHVNCRTMNALGHRVWAEATGKRLILNKDKMYDLLRAEMDTLSRPDRAEIQEIFGEVRRSLSAAKLAGYIPNGHTYEARRLLDDTDFYSSFEEEPSGFLIDLIERLLSRSIAMSYEGNIDFDDQVWMSTLFGGRFPSYPLVLVDEAQDLSPLNHEMLKKLVAKRLIAVGDPFQSIYLFRGSMSNSMEVLKTNFSMTELPLSVSFRCPIEVVKKARKRAPHMQWPDWAIPGEVHELEAWTPKDIPDGAAVICRNNAPLFSCALQLLRAGRGVKLLGSDIGGSLVKVLKKLGPETMPRADVITAIENWRTAQLRKSRNKSSTEDRAECLMVFAEFAETLGGAITYAEHLFAAGGPIQLMSGHKAKGLEFDIVYHLDPWRIPSKWAVDSDEALQQEHNLYYVITTRAKQALYLVNLTDLKAA